MDLDLRRRLLLNIDPTPDGTYLVLRDDKTVFCTCGTRRSAESMLRSLDALKINLERDEPK